MATQQTSLSGNITSGSGGGGSTSNLSNFEEEDRPIGIRPRKRKERSIEYEFKRELADFRREITKFFQDFAATQNETLSHIRQEVTELTNEIKCIKNTTEKLNLKYETLQQEVENIKSENQVLQDRLQQSEQINISATAASSVKSLSPTHEDLMLELKDRCEREKNVVLIGINEICDKSYAARRKHDDCETFKIITSLFEQCPKPIKTMRLGTYNPGKNRPLKVCFESTTIPKQLLRNKSKLPNNFRLYADQTPSQKNYLKRLSEELQKRKENGETDLTIKYIQGVPKIIKSKNE